MKNLVICALAILVFVSSPLSQTTDWLYSTQPTENFFDPSRRVSMLGGVKNDAKPNGAGTNNIVFVTSTTYAGDLGGVTGGDIACQSRAVAAGLTGTYRAWLSSDTLTPAGRFPHSTSPYTLVNGTVIANNWTDLTDGSLLAAIDRTETGNVVASSAVWTGTQANGTAASATCNSWFSTAVALGSYGNSSATTSGWSNSGSTTCSTPARLYCFLQLGNAPEIDVRGNNASIPDGDTTPDLSDHTDFGSANVTGGTVVRTFAIHNTGSANLNIGAITLGGPDAGDFSINTTGMSPVLSPGGNTTFNVTFDPTAAGLRTASVSIVNDDADENPYEFTIQGTGFAWIDPGINTIVFVTSTTHTGNLGGVIGGDIACQSRAASAGLTGTYGPWLSSDTLTPAGRFPHSTSPYTLVNGTVIANNWTDLTDGSLLAPIDRTETGNVVASSAVWTGTQANGTASSATCSGWLSTAGPLGSYGNSSATTSGWSNSGSTTCSTPARLYCFLQVASLPDINVTPTSINFGSQNVGSATSAQTVTIQNLGAGPLSVTGISFTGANPTNFAYSGITFPANIPAGNQVQFGVTFTPSAVGERTATMQIASDDPDESPVNVALSGTGFNGANFATVQFPKDIPSVVSGSTTTVYGRVYEPGVTNISPTNSNLITSQLGYGPQGSSPAGGVWTWGASGPNVFYACLGADCDFDEHSGNLVAPAPGAYSYGFRFSLDGGTNWVYAGKDINLNSDATTGWSTMTVVSGPPFAQTNAATNITGTTATLNGLGSSSGAATTGYFRYSTVSPGTCNNTFGTRTPAAGGTDLGNTAINAPFDEDITGLVAGTTYYFCAITQNSNGTALGSLMSFMAGSPEIEIVPAAMDFGDQTEAVASGLQSVTIRNTGTANLVVGTLTLSGTNPGDFAMFDNPSGATIAPGSSRQLRVRFTPGALGGRTAEVNIPSNDADENPTVVSLSGNGVAAATPSLEKALWVFGGSIVPNPVSDSTGRATLISRSGANNVDTLYVSVYQGTNNTSGRRMYEDTDMAALIAAAHANGQEVWAAYGDVNWHTFGCSASDFPVQRMAEVAAYNTSRANPAERFDGVMLDVEPVEPLSTADFQALISHYECMRNSLPSSIKLGAAIRFFWDDDNVTYPVVGGTVKPAAHHMIDLNLDKVVVMGYRDFAGDTTNNGIIDVDENEINYATAQGRAGLILAGLETKDLGVPAEEFVTFFEEGQAVMDSESALVAAHFASSSGFGGFAIHNYLDEYLSGITGWPTVPPTPDINVDNGNASIPDEWPIPEDFGTTGTTFGSITREWRISNVGNAVLNLDGTPTVQITGAHPGDFTVTQQPASTSLSAFQSTTFRVTFDPTEAGTRTATVVIPSNDPDENPYNFDLRGEAITAPPPVFGTYADTQVALSGNTTIASTAAPTDTNHLGVIAPPELAGKITAERTTGAVRITNASPARIPAGSYPITLIATGYGGQQTTTFNLTIEPEACAGTSGFTNGTDLSSANSKTGLIVGDFNGDGNQDVAEIAGVANRVAIQLGDGAGGFTFTGSYIDVGTVPLGGAVGDLNNDGMQDIAIANYGSNNVTILQGTGTGSFFTAATVSVGTNPYSAAVGDFNGDGNLDLATANASGSVSIRIGNGVGGFTGTTDLPVGGASYSVAISDFNNDGKQDIAASSSAPDHVSVRLGDGAGNFGTATDISVGSGPRSVAIGDFNGDGNKDIAASGLTTISIRLGDGLGGFSGTTEVPAGSSLWSVAIGDFNGDGKQDLAAASLDTDAVAIRHGDGSGNFSTTADIAVGDGPEEIAVGDFNEDGFQDFATANSLSSLASVRLGDCVAPEMDVIGNGQSIADGDTTPDLTDHTDFGSADVSGETVSRTFTIDNLGTADLNLTGTPLIAVSGANASDFAVTVSPSTPVAAAGSTTFQVTFDPSAEGLRSAEVSIANNDADENPYTFAIQGTGATSSVLASVPGDVNFGPATVGGNAVISGVLIMNSGSPVEITALPITGPNAADFSASVAGGLPVTLNDGESLAVDLTFAPSATGSRVATLGITSNPGSMLTVPLSGNGIRTLVVDTLLDDPAADECTPATSDCSLRRAIGISNDGDIITFDPGMFSSPSQASAVAAPQTIVLAGSEIVIDTDITINGPGATLLTVDANNASRVFAIGQSADVSMSGMTLTGGNGIFGGAIYVDILSDLSLTGMTITGNTAALGGGILADSPVTIMDSIISGNSAGSFGGGINARWALTVTNSTISGNTAPGGGGIFGTPEDGGTPSLNVSRSTFYDNCAGSRGGGGSCIATGRGGAIQFSAANQPFAIVNSTFSGNGGFEGGGLSFAGAAGSVTSSTFVNSNIRVYGDSFNSFALPLSNTILSGGGCIFGTGSSIVDGGFNLDSGHTCGLTEPTSKTGTDPLLGPLQNNGGPTLTHGFNLALGMSPAIDAGSSFGLTTDQRGINRTVNVFGVTDTDDGTDIGAFEFQAPTAAPASIAGRVMTSGGVGIRGVVVTVQGMDGGVWSATTNTFGYYRIEGLPAGASYLVSVNSRRYSFPNGTQLVNLEDNVSGLDFTASP